MGANFQLMTVAGGEPVERVKAVFAAKQDEDRYENGHVYSGGFGMATGLTFTAMSFDTEDLARAWLEEHCQKWEEAKVVRVQNFTWMIGAWCAS